ncbi:mitochondrial half-size ABC transporter [Mycena pura]|uniref:Mitochondrial half-size ABC transporter n=1 Tax=Mycena pura TaxID=153505 RepID=A0AAD6YEV5_9AGAR|nr:mitochondrial half-size ABC transporter [Mycena pura]
MASAPFVLRVLAPALVCLATLSILPATPSPPPSPSAITRVVVPSVIPRRALILSLISLSAFTFLLDGLIFVAFAVIDKSWPQNTGIEYNAVLGLVAFAGLAALGAWKDIRGVDVWSMKRIKFTVAISSALDLALVVLLAKTIRFGGSRFPLTHESITIIFPSLRVLTGLILVASLASPRIVYKAVSHRDEDAAPTDSSLLLPPPSTGLSPLSALPSEPSKYGTFRPARSTLPQSNPATRGASPLRSEEADAKPSAKPEISLDPSWSEIWRRMSRILPYLWPSKSRFLQLLVVFCIILILLGRVVNASIPFTLGEIVSIFEGGSSRSIWPVLLFYVLLRFLQGGGGLAALRDVSYKAVLRFEMSQLAFDHLLQLSFNFHTHRNTGQLLRVLDRGAAINRTLEHILFTVVPTFIDVVVALVVFCYQFGWTLALVVFLVVFAYVAASVVITRWRTKIRRQMNERDVITRGIHSDCLLNYETIKYFGGEEHEGERYRQAIGQYQELEYKVIFSLNLLNLVQNFIISTGLLVGSMIVALRVTKGQSTAADFIIFITYLAQLYGPLNQLGFMYRSINQSLVDTEKLLELLNQPKDVHDKDDAATLVVDGGEIEFDNVSFSYDNRTTALDGVSFKVPKGSSVALVGESGAGKSTILRLLYRFYDLPEGGGRILIDGQDIRDVTQKSLRAAIGVVPQDCVLFNTSIAYNIGYGKFNASSEEIEEAATSAQMHERITHFPDVNSMLQVGERGVRLSGGEKQRVAIARYIYRNSSGALDTSTEKDIQKALLNLMQGRSSLSIAHRLSTIASADVILVLKDGRIVEHGTHAELLALDGVFASMWADQVSTSGDALASTMQPLPDTEVLGYSAEAELLPEATEVVTTEGDLGATLQEVGPAEPDPEDQPMAVSDDILDVSTKDSTIPSALSEAPAPTSTPAAEQVTFPTSHDTTATEVEGASAAQAPAVTFEPGLTSGLADPETEPKRKRISSQNFQRLARRISLQTKRQGSSSSIASIIPGLKRERTSGDDSSVRAEGSSRNSVDSPTASLSGDKDKGKSKKKDKRKSSS